MRYLFFVIILIFLFFSNSCRKEKLLTDGKAKIQFSTDTILFDTVFTTVGSTTRALKIYNRNNGKIIISDIRLAGGTFSNFRINVDGSPGVYFEDIEIEAGDSIYVFAEVTIDPNNGTNPMVIEDSILFNTNGNRQKVILNAWGQDAYFHVKELISNNTTWMNDKPHVIYNYTAVDSNVTLTIPAGTNVYAHANSTLLIYKGSLQVNGSASSPVNFKGDRLEPYYDSISGQWRGIYFFEPQTSLIQYANIRNAQIGIQIDTLKTGQFVNLEQVKVENSSFFNILTQGANLNAVNCLFSLAGINAASIRIGGNVYFDHCTFANYWRGGTRQTPAVLLTDYYVAANQTVQYRPFNNLNINNSIISGYNTNELVVDTLSRTISGMAPVFKFDYCLIKTEEITTNATHYSNIKKNLNPAFIDVFYWNFKIGTNSAAKDYSFNSTTFIDLIGSARDGFPDAGCYEAQ
ncbi:MAG: hypothetical protein ACK4K0_08190 [Flavobacteriales bacterium]